MASVVVAGDTSGSVTISAPAIAGSTTLTLPSTSGTVLTNSTALTVTSTQSANATAISFSSIPSTTKMITVNFNNVYGAAATCNLTMTSATSYNGFYNDSTNLNSSTAWSGNVFLPALRTTYRPSSVTLTLADSTNNIWAVYCNVLNTSDKNATISMGLVTLSTTVSALTINLSVAQANGTISLTYQ